VLESALEEALRPALAADYRRAGIELGQSFTERLSMAQILAGLDAAHVEAMGPQPSPGRGIERIDPDGPYLA
jgi:hypothetical protein